VSLKVYIKLINDHGMCSLTFLLFYFLFSNTCPYWSNLFYAFYHCYCISWIFRLMFNTSCCLSIVLTFQIACKVVAMVLHYFFLSSFTWMMVEGIALYFSCTHGLYNHGDMRMKYCFVGWLIPLVIVVISIGGEFPHYGNSERNR